jgi:hypothetical protein
MIELMGELATFIKDNYLIIGLVFYLVICAGSIKSFSDKGVTKEDVMKGFVFGVLAWPAAMGLVAYRLYKKHTKK